MRPNRRFSVFLTSEELPPLRYGQYRFYIWDEWQQPRGFAIVFPTGESAGGVLDDYVNETESQREIRLFAAEQLLTWLDSDESSFLPPGWRPATDNEASVVLHTWRQFAA